MRQISRIDKPFAASERFRTLRMFQSQGLNSNQNLKNSVFFSPEIEEHIFAVLRHLTLDYGVVARTHHDKWHEYLVQQRNSDRQHQKKTR